MIVKVLVSLRIGRRGGQYVGYLDAKASSSLMKYIHKNAILHLDCIYIKVTLAIDKSFKPPRIAVWLPKSLNPTWEELYDKDVNADIELQEGDAETKVIDYG